MAASINVGRLNDKSDAPTSNGHSPGGFGAWLNISRAKAGQLAPIRHRLGPWLPARTAVAVEHAYRRRVEDDVMLMVGPQIDDDYANCDTAGRQWRMPTINWAGAEWACSSYMFCGS